MLDKLKSGDPIIDVAKLATITILGLSGQELAILISIIGGILYCVNQFTQIRKNLRNTEDD